jgi:acetyl esterase
MRDGGELYGQRLLEAGVPAKVVRYDGMKHVFMHLNRLILQADQALNQAIQALQAAFAL